MHVADLLNENLEQAKARKTTMEKMCGSCYTSAPSNIVRNIVKSKYAPLPLTLPTLC